MEAQATEAVGRIFSCLETFLTMRAHRHDEMPVDVEGWLSSPRVQRMTAAERGMFFELLCRAWADQDCSLPEDEDELKFLARATDDEWGSGSKRVLAMFDSKDGRLTNAKQREKLAEQNGRLAAAKANRERVAKHRAERESGINGVAKTLPDGFPKDEKEAIQWCQMHAAHVSEKAIRLYYHDAASRGGCDYRGMPVQSWVSYVVTQWGKFGEKLPGMGTEPPKKKGSTIAV